jgi:putative tricarboxylic transport membrane protein
MFDRIFSLILIALGGALYWHSKTMTTELSSGSVGPDALPKLLGAALLLIATLNLALALRKKTATTESGGNQGDPAYRQFLVLVGLLVAYALVLEPLGYVISTFLFLLASFQTMQRGKLIKSAVIAAAFSCGVYLLYVKVALGSLPPLPFIN